jgi:hypothetical protein
MNRGDDMFFGGEAWVVLPVTSVRRSKSLAATIAMLVAATGAVTLLGCTMDAAMTRVESAQAECVAAGGVLFDSSNGYVCAEAHLETGGM